MHEIITLQLGQRSNYLATHFWNTQESYFTYTDSDADANSSTVDEVDHDVHFRPGIGADGTETFTPRTVIYDLKGGFGSLRKINALYDMQEEGEGGSMPRGLWHGNVVVHKQDAIAQSAYQQSLDTGIPPTAPLKAETVRYWSDFNRVFYHPRSIIQLNDFELNSRLMPFERWDFGEELFASLDKEHDILDRDFRLWAEECDQLQGIQIVTGADDAWGGFAGKYVERLRDEFGKGAIWVWGIEDGSRAHRDKQLLRTINAARSMHDISAQSSMYIPVSDPPIQLPAYVSVDRTSQWHTAGLLSIALESVTLQWRLRASNTRRWTMDDFEAAINVNGKQRIAKLECSVINPALLEEQKRERGIKEASTADPRMPGRTTVPVTGTGTSPGTSSLLHDEAGLQAAKDASLKHLDMDFFVGHSSQTNAPMPPGQRTRVGKESHVFGHMDSFRGEFERASGEEGGGEAAYARKRRRIAGLPLVEKCYSSLCYPLLDSFPKIFSEWSDHTALVAVHSSLSTTSKVAERVKSLQRVVGRMVGLDERETLSNGLGEIGEAYEDGWGSGSDSGDDI
ncbi:MAG: hypothetical protein FRX48_04209 [Lasallia pustulata]|uniref:Tubulin nucleotide-binding domain-like protein n=1 Tax=Lasallia pustulata TaxID=136370 RepID=A0A5M8PRA7_9LECA|nr:MAG: hypothetical protein FRX48_04209 [Lasallia pustulata]